MSRYWVFFGQSRQVKVEDVLAQWRSIGPGARDALIILAAFLVVTGAVMVWAVFLRKPSRRHSHHHHHHHHHHSEERTPNSGAEAESEELHHGSRRRKWRRPRREHRPRNPTLAETGGLPPIRDPGPSERQP